MVVRVQEKARSVRERGGGDNNAWRTCIQIARVGSRMITCDWDYVIRLRKNSDKSQDGLHFISFLHFQGLLDYFIILAFKAFLFHNDDFLYKNSTTQLIQSV